MGFGNDVVTEAAQSVSKLQLPSARQVAVAADTEPLNAVKNNPGSHEMVAVPGLRTLPPGNTVPLCGGGYG